MVAERRSPDAEGSMAATAAATRATFRMPKTVASALDGGRSRAFLFFLICANWNSLSFCSLRE